MDHKYNISIEYCVPWNYVSRAVGAAQDLMANYQHVIEELTFIMGVKGAFEVKVDGELVYSKKQLDRHAEEGEVLKLFQEIVGPDVPLYPQTKE